MYVCVYVCMSNINFYSTFTLTNMHKDNWMHYGNEKLCAKCHENNTKISFINLFVCSFIFRGGFLGQM